MGETLHGKELANELRQETRECIAELSRNNRPPVLAVIIAGDDQASIYYAGIIKKGGAKEGIEVHINHIKEPSTDGLVDLVNTLNHNTEVDGILIQLPLPRGIDKNKIFTVLSPDKDVDGQSPVNLGKLLAGQEGIVPATARAVIKLLKGNTIDIYGKHAVVIGRSTAVGLPSAVLLLRENATVSICHTKSDPLEDYTKRADILVVSAGVPKLIKQKHIKEGASVVDVGTNEVDGQMVGDVDFEDVMKVASVSPVTGGVGSLTLACLFENTCELYRKNISGNR